MFGLVKSAASLIPVPPSERVCSLFRKLLFVFVLYTLESVNGSIIRRGMSCVCMVMQRYGFIIPDPGSDLTSDGLIVWIISWNSFCSPKQYQEQWVPLLEGRRERRIDRNF